MNPFEPVLMDHPDYDRITKIVYASYPNACILMIDRINNPTLQAAYTAKRDAAGGAQSANERQVYHGTKSRFIHSIATKGFLASLNTVSAHGKGTYFARDFGYSRDYSDTDEDGISNMFLCKILAGKMEVAGGRMNVPEGVDTFVNTLPNPSIYVVPEDARTLPEFLVRYHKTV